MRQLVTLCPHAAIRENEYWYASLSPFHSVWTPIHRMGTPIFKADSSHFKYSDQFIFMAMLNPIMISLINVLGLETARWVRFSYSQV